MPAIKNQRGDVYVDPHQSPTPKPQSLPVPASAPMPAPAGKAAVLAQTEPKPYPTLEPPVPVLQQHGFNGGIQQFSYRVQKVVDSYQKAYGSKPSPGLIFDLARSPFDVGKFDELFTVPTNSASAKARQIINSVPSTDTLVERHDGLVEHNNPARQLLYQQPGKELKKYQGLQGEHPWVAAGMLPISGDLLSSFWKAISFAQGHEGAAKPLTEDGMSLSQYEQENKIGQSLTSSAGALESYGQMAADHGAASTQARTDALALSDRFTVARGARTVKAAQDALKQVAPDFFSQLPTSGFVNSDWAKAIGKYQTSAQYFRQQTLQLAHDNHFGDNTAAFMDAWKTKQAAIKKQPFLAPFLSHQPLAFFDTRTHGGAAKNLFLGDTKGWGWANVPTVGLGALVHTAGVALDEIVGTVDTAKQDAAFVSAYMQSIQPKGTIFAPGGMGMTETQARQRAFQMLREKPSWARVINPNYDLEGQQGTVGGKELAPFANAAVDLMIGAPKFTGERVLAGDEAKLVKSRYFNAKTDFAYAALKQGKVGEATASLEGGLGAERLNVMLEDAVKADDVGLAEYRKHAAELYAHGRTTVGDTEVNGALLRSLRSKDLHTPGSLDRGVQDLRAKVSAHLDQYENSLRANKQVGATSNAANLVASVRQLTARAAPGAERRYIFDERAPEDVYNWARVNLKDQAVATELRDSFIRFRSKDDIQGITGLSDRMRALYAKAHPGSDIKANPLESAGPELESESRSYLYFPKSLETTAQKINSKLNALGRTHRQVIVGGSPIPFAPVPGFGESLMYKHAIADTTRRIIGGGGFFGVTGDLKKVQAEVERFSMENPEVLRTIGVNRSAAKMGENRWITGTRTEDPQTFNTGDFLDSGKHMTAAGGYLRHMLSSKGLKAFQQSTADDLGPLMDLITGDKTFRSLTFKDAKTFTPSKDWQALPDGLDIPTGAEVRLHNNVRQVRWGDNPPATFRYGGTTTTDAAQGLWRRYREVEEAGQKAGVADPLNEALSVLATHAGPKGDAELGKWIGKNGVDFAVRDGLVEASQWDSYMNKWIGVLMTANKWNRGTLFDHVFYSTVRDLNAAGWEMGDAVGVAADLAKAQTVSHMLDFANMLQVEQHMRWLSYFATKHRLYWSWILRQAVERPGLGAAVGDVKDHLDSTGNLNFTLFGRRLFLPAARLFWVNAREYPQTSPIVQGGVEAAKGAVEGHGAQSFADAASSLTSTSGNVFTRDDQAEALSIKLALIHTGALPATTSAVTFGMPSQQAKQIRAAVNAYSAFFKAEHGDWPTESDAVKHAVLGMAAQSWWNSNLFFPLQADTVGSASPEVKKLLTKYGRIADPAKKRAFLDQHPEVALRFGVSDDPAVYLHNNNLWDKFNAAQKQVQQARDLIYQEILKTGFTVDVSKKMSALSTSWSKTIDELKIEDAATWAGSAQFPKGKISDGQVLTPGPWGVAIEGDPFTARAFVHQSFPEIARPELNAHTVGVTIVELQKEAARLRSADTPAKITALGYPDAQHVRERLSQINQTLSPFFAYPKDAPAKLQSDYYKKFVGPYITQRDKQAAKLALAPSDQQDALRSEFRAWKDQHDHPVFLEVDGKKIRFPSVVQIGWARLPEDQRHLGLAQAVSGDWAHVASYEKTLLGVKTSPKVSEGWAAFADAVGQYSKNPKNPSLVGAQRNGLARQIDRVYPGFYKDFLFAQKPKIDRFMATDVYRQMPDRPAFDEVVGRPARELAKEIKANGHRDYYAKYWRQYVETKVLPWLDSQPALKKEMADYGPDFLGTLPG